MYNGLFKPHGIEEDVFYRTVHKWDDNGYRDKREVFKLVVEELSCRVTVEDMFDHFKQHYGHDAQLFEGVENVLTTLRQRYSLALITNGRTQGQRRKLAKTGITHFFDHILISEAEGLKKPDPQLYLRACEKMSVAPEQVLFVGDHPRNDVEIPKQLGMKAIWVSNAVYDPPTEHDGVIQSVVELPSLL